MTIFVRQDIIFGEISRKKNVFLLLRDSISFQMMLPLNWEFKNASLVFCSRLLMICLKCCLFSCFLLMNVAYHKYCSNDNVKFHAFPKERASQIPTGLVKGDRLQKFKMVNVWIEKNAASQKIYRFFFDDSHWRSNFQSCIREVPNVLLSLLYCRYSWP